MFRFYSPPSIFLTLIFNKFGAIPRTKKKVLPKKKKDFRVQLGFNGHPTRGQCSYPSQIWSLEQTFSTSHTVTMAHLTIIHTIITHVIG